MAKSKQFSKSNLHKQNFDNPWPRVFGTNFICNFQLFIRNIPFFHGNRIFTSSIPRRRSGILHWSRGFLTIQSESRASRSGWPWSTWILKFNETKPSWPQSVPQSFWNWRTRNTYVRVQSLIDWMHKIGKTFLQCTFLYLTIRKVYDVHKIVRWRYCIMKK